MQPNHPDNLDGPVTAGPSLAASEPYARIFLGILLAFIGIGLEAIGFAITYLTLNGPSQTMNDLILRQSFEAGAEVLAIALWGIGLFLVFFYVAQVRPGTKPWTSTAAIVLLATGLAGAILRWVEFRNWYALVLGGPFSAVIPILQITAGLHLATALVGSTATIVALFGLTRPPSLVWLRTATAGPPGFANRSILSPTVS